jgi:hypothetical protein
LFTGLFAGAMKLTAADEQSEDQTEEAPAAEESEGIVPAPEKSEA